MWRRSGNAWLPPKTYLDSEGVNVLQVLCDLLDLVEQMNTAVAGHKHGAAPPPDTAGEFAAHAGAATALAGHLKPITGCPSRPYRKKGLIRLQIGISILPSTF